MNIFSDNTHMISNFNYFIEIEKLDLFNWKYKICIYLNNINYEPLKSWLNYRQYAYICNKNKFIGSYSLIKPKFINNEVIFDLYINRDEYYTNDKKSKQINELLSNKNFSYNIWLEKSKLSNSVSILNLNFE